MNRWIHSLLLGCALLAGGCATAPLPASNANAGMSAGAPRAVLYVDPARYNSTHFIAPPPSAEEGRREIEAMLVLQNQRTPEQAARAAADGEQSVFRFADVLGPRFTAQNLPLTAALFERLYRTQSALNKQGKTLWERQRPPLADTRLQPVARYSSSGSYPSGHATFSYLAGIVLGDMVPEQRTHLLERAREFGNNRVLGGVHYPSDVEAGRQLAVLIAALAPQSPDYQRDFAAARAELRGVLALP